MTRTSLANSFLSFAVSLGVIACSSNTPSPQPGTGGQASGGVLASGGTSGSGGAAAGGTTATAQTGTGGNPATGGKSASGGTSATGGDSATGGTSAGATGGVPSSGGVVGKGGATVAGGAGGGAGTVGTGGAGPGSGGALGTDAGTGRDGAVTGSGGAGSGGSGGRVGGSGGQASLDGAPPVGGSGGSGAYNPCKASPCKILPLGDSITHGVASTDDAGYRSALFKLIVAANQNVTFTGSLSNGPSTVSSKTFPKSHEGHDGFTVESGYSTYGTAGISSLIPSPAFSTVPDIVLLHIGTNDLTSTSAKSTTSDRLDTLLTKIVGVAPDALIVVAKVVPLGYSSSDWDTYNAKIPTVVQTHAGKGQHVVMVDMSKLPTSQLTGVHPNDQGYAYMANIWYEAIKGFLP